MDLQLLHQPLKINEIDFRVQSVNKGGYATILAYKDARVDMNRLDKVIWPWLWKREHFDNNSKCRVSIYNTEIKEWVSKEDVWTASNTEKEKWLASDSFKRACFNWGIWRELYDYPIIQIQLNNTEFEIVDWKAKTTWGFHLNNWTWGSKFNDDWILTHLAVKDENWKIRFNWKNALLLN